MCINSEASGGVGMASAVVAIARTLAARSD
jgi:hypothetical protein